MAAIGKIRQHYGILIIIIGVALLAFILNDLFTSKNRGVKQTEIAVVNGKNIDRVQWSNLYEYYKYNYGNVSKSMEYRLQMNALEQLISEALINEEYEKAGITVSDDEVSDLFFGKKPSQVLVRYFSDGNGGLDAKRLDSLYNMVKTMDQSPEYTQQQVDWLQSQWRGLEEEVINDRMWSKYRSLIEHGYYMPTKLADRYNENRDLTRSAEVYVVRYSTITDSAALAALTDDDYKAFYEENKYKYNVEQEVRTIEYVVFDVKPTEADEKDAKDYVNGLVDDFKAKKDVASIISFVNKKSNVPCDTTWKKVTAFPPVLAEMIEKNNAGTICEPYAYDKAYNLAKIIGKATRDGELWAQVAIIKHPITAGASTMSAVRNEAKRFNAENKNIEQFDAAVESKGLRKGVAKLTKDKYEIDGIKDSRSVVRWAFENDVEVGSLTKEPYPLDNMFIVAVLTDIMPEGYMPYEECINQNIEIIKKWKKGQIIANEAKQYGTDYDAMINALGGEKIELVNFSFDNPEGRLGAEERISGTIMGMKEGVFSQPIQGGDLFAVVKVTSTKPSGETDYEKIKTDNKAVYQNGVVNAVYSALRKAAKVENNMEYYF